jgi:PPM family protein phosphatase
MRYAAITDRGRVRPSNEDAYLADANLELLIVADGMGGAQAGEVASRIAVETLKESIAQPADGPDEALQEAIMDAHRVVKKAAEHCEHRRGMGTTVVAVWHPPQSAHVFIAHVGDSRAYLLREDALYQLTEDHTVRQQVLAGQQEGGVRPLDLPPRHALSQALGRGDWLAPSGSTVSLLPGDRFLLCTDGLTGSISDADVRDVLIGPGSPEELCSALVTLANQRDGRDNVTAALACFDNAVGD